MELSARELAAKVQIDQTPNHEAAVGWSNFAVELATTPFVRAKDPTLAGEVYRNRALHLELWGKPVENVDATIRASLLELGNSDDPKVVRERGATHSILGRIARHRILTGRAYGNIHDVRPHHHVAQQTFRDQHSFFRTWDRYATMDDRQRATSEVTVPKGSAVRAATLSLRGMWRAWRANDEEQPREAHRAFVKKQLGANALAGFVAITKPIAAVPGVRGKRVTAIEQLTD